MGESIVYANYHSATKTMEFRKEKNQKLIFFDRLSFLCRPSLGDLKVGNWGSVICSFQSAGMVAFYLSLVYFTSKYLKIKKPEIGRAHV